MATLNDDEVAALMSAIQEGQVPPNGFGRSKGSVASYDLTSQDRIIRSGEMPTLDAINERAAGTFGTGLAGRTRLDLRVASAASSMMKFGDLTPLLAPPASIAVLSLGAGREQALVVMEENLADILLAALLGDRRARPEERPEGVRRDLTSVERQVLRRAVNIFCDALTDGWKETVPFQVEVLRFESDPRLCVVAPSSDVAILIPFELTGAINGRMQLVMPYAAVETSRKLLASPPRSPGSSDGRFGRQLAEELNKVQVDLCALLGHTTLRLDTLLALEVGDVLTLDSTENEPIPVMIEGRHKIDGLPVPSGSSLAVKITRLIPPELAATPAAHRTQPPAGIATGAPARAGTKPR